MKAKAEARMRKLEASSSFWIHRFVLFFSRHWNELFVIEELSIFSQVFKVMSIQLWHGWVWVWHAAVGLVLNLGCRKNWRNKEQYMWRKWRMRWLSLTEQRRRWERLRKLVKRKKSWGLMTLHLASAPLVKCHANSFVCMPSWVPQFHLFVSLCVSLSLSTSISSFVFFWIELVSLLQEICSMFINHVSSPGVSF